MSTAQTALEVYSSIANAVNSVKAWTAADVQGDIDDLPAYGRLRDISGELVKLLNIISGTEEQSSVEDSEDGHFTETPAEKKARAVVIRVAVINSLVQDSAITMATFSGDMQTLDPTPIVKRENECIARLYQPYPDLSEGEWTSALAGFKAPYLTDRERILARGAVDLLPVPGDAIPDPADRLSKREQHLYDESTINAGTSILHLIIRQIESVKFAMDWERIGMQVNGKLYKAAFLKSTYGHSTALPVSRNDKRFAAFKAEHKRQISARSLIRELFLEFGVAVLMSRACDVISLERPSKNLRQTLALLRASRPPVTLLDRQVKVNIFRMVVSVISDAETAAYVSDFLYQFPGFGVVPPRHPES